MTTRPRSPEPITARAETEAAFWTWRPSLVHPLPLGPALAVALWW